MGAEAEAMPKEMTGLVRPVAEPELGAALAAQMDSEAILAVAANRAAAAARTVSVLTAHRSQAQSGRGNEGPTQPVGL